MPCRLSRGWPWCGRIAPGRLQAGIGNKAILIIRATLLPFRPPDESGDCLFGFAGASAPPDKSGGCLFGFAGALLFGDTRLVPTIRSGSPSAAEGGRRGRAMRPRLFARYHTNPAGSWSSGIGAMAFTKGISAEKSGGSGESGAISTGSPFTAKISGVPAVRSLARTSYITRTKAAAIRCLSMSPHVSSASREPSVTCGNTSWSF